MITVFIEDVISDLLTFLFSLIPNLPNLPQNLHDTLINFIDLIFDYGGSLIGLFVHISTLKVVLPILIIILNFDKIYKIVIWIIRKIPINIS